MEEIGGCISLTSSVSLWSIAALTASLKSVGANRSVFNTAKTNDKGEHLLGQGVWQFVNVVRFCEGFESTEAAHVVHVVSCPNLQSGASLDLVLVDSSPPRPVAAR